MIRTERLVLVPATPVLLRAELAGSAAVAAALGFAVPESWPPELFDADAVRYFLERGGDDPWRMSYVVRRAEEGREPELVGVAGFKGPPDARGAVEIGYAIVEAQRRRGYASEAVAALLRVAFESPEVTTVAGETLAHLHESIGVLIKAGFEFAGDGYDPGAPEGVRVVRYERARGGEAA